MSEKMNKALEAVNSIDEFCKDFENIIHQLKLDQLGKGGDGNDTLLLFSELDKLRKIIRGIRINNNGVREDLNRFKGDKLYRELSG